LRKRKEGKNSHLSFVIGKKLKFKEWYGKSMNFGKYGKFIFGYLSNFIEPVTND